MSIQATADQVQRHIYFSTYEDGKIKVLCNVGNCNQTFFDGKDWDAPDSEEPWLANAITHLITKHAELLS